MSDATHPPNTDADAPAPPQVMPAQALQPPPIMRINNRLIALPIFVAGATVLGLAAWLSPSGEGMGTHTQLGLPPCSFEQVTGVPCATCGCTTSFAHAANGSLLDSFITQPFGALLAVLTAMAVIIAGYALVTDMPLAPLARALTRGRVIAVFMTFMMLAWGYTIVRHVG